MTPWLQAAARQVATTAGASRVTAGEPRGPSRHSRTARVGEIRPSGRVMVPAAPFTCVPRTTAENQTPVPPRRRSRRLPRKVQKWRRQAGGRCRRPGRGSRQNGAPLRCASIKARQAHGGGRPPAGTAAAPWPDRGGHPAPSSSEGLSRGGDAPLAAFRCFIRLGTLATRSAATAAACRPYPGGAGRLRMRPAGLYLLPAA